MNEFRPSRFEVLPPVIKNLLIINVLVLVAQNTVASQFGFPMDNLFALHSWKSPLFQPWQLLTHMFMHAGYMHIFGNMINLWFFGATLENLWGAKRFITFYIVCGLGAALLHLLVLNIEISHLTSQYLDLVAMHTSHTIGESQAMIAYINEHHLSLNVDTSYIREHANDPNFMEQLLSLVASSYNNVLNVPTVGASGAVFGVMAGFAYLFPNNFIYLNFFIPLKVKWYVLGYFCIELFYSVQNSIGDHIAHWAHVGGAIVGLLIVMTWNKTNRKTFY